MNLYITKVDRFLWTEARENSGFIVLELVVGSLDWKYVPVTCPRQNDEIGSTISCSSHVKHQSGITIEGKCFPSNMSMALVPGERKKVLT